MFEDIFSFVRETFKTPEGVISLHEPRFDGNEKKYLNEAVDSTFVSSVGKFVDQAERKVAKILGAKRAVLCVNGTTALQVSLQVAGLGEGQEVITQALTFVATANAIRHLGAHPVFVDVDPSTLGMSAQALEDFLDENVEKRESGIFNRRTGRQIVACLPMHTFGHPCEIDRIHAICEEWGLALVEDAAEALGSIYHGKPVGRFGICSAFSFNGNKIVTSGGGGAIVTDDEGFADRARHLTTTAKLSHPWDFTHTDVGYNFRMPNINAALLLAQLEKLDEFLEQKRNLAKKYENFFEQREDVQFLKEPPKSRSNYWLCAVKFKTHEFQQSFLSGAHKNGILVRPPWKLMTDLEMYKGCSRGDLSNSREIQDKVVNLPSSARKL